ncbi:MAG: tRNA glutamyl-Q(34) synthetase GluQRS [Alphaproteobacteria bacterium]|nr:tRNA glutamyl-Q(34) synthetase GluQRS [Alphaproteobacteria bacterium]
MAFVTRFAPSPTGLLHLGHAFSALTAWDAARAAGGRFLLRIEDIDAGRSRAEFEAAILEDLAWLGLGWETPVLRQSERMADYAAVLERLISLGVVYRCFRTRKEVLAGLVSAPHGPETLFFGAPPPRDEEAERLARGEAFAWRLSAAQTQALIGDRVFEDETGRLRADFARLGDAVIARKDFPTSYHLASVWDDAEQGVTHVIRGEDLRDSAHLHVALQALLGLATPIYRHHRLILGDDGKRLAKRDRAASLREIRESGVTPAGVRKILGLA